MSAIDRPIFWNCELHVAKQNIPRATDKRLPPLLFCSIQCAELGTSYTSFPHLPHEGTQSLARKKGKYHNVLGVVATTPCFGE